MNNKFIFLVLVTVSLLFMQCKRDPIAIKPSIIALSDFESNDGAISINITGGKAPYAIEWSTGGADTLLSKLEAGTYYVTINDAKGNVLIDTLEVPQPPYPVCIDDEGNNYKTAVIGNQVWMLENLHVTITPLGEPIDYLCPDSSNMSENGLLYTWKSAMADSVNAGTQGLCPDGWHLPSDREWFELTDHIKQEGLEITKVFEPQYAGFYNNGFNNEGVSVSYWSSTSAKDNAWKRFMHKDLTKVFRYHEKKDNAISVRCIRN